MLGYDYLMGYLFALPMILGVKDVLNVCVGETVLDFSDILVSHYPLGLSVPICLSP